MTQTYEAPPLGGGASESGFRRQRETFQEDSNFNVSLQGPRHIGEITAKMLLDTCEKQILRQIEKLSNPAFGGSAPVEAQEYLQRFLIAFEEAAGRPFDLEDAA